MNRMLSAEVWSIGHEISWAGFCPWTGTMCVGTDDGYLSIGPRDSRGEGAFVSVVPGDAVNGIAFSRDYAAISSPSAVVVLIRKKADPLELRPLRHGYSGGAHGIVASAHGSFLAALGDDGILTLNLDANGKPHSEIAKPKSGSPYFYKIVPLCAQENGKEFHVCAARRDGLLLFTFENGNITDQLRGYRLGEEDIIDVCPLDDHANPFGVVCLSRSCGIFVVPDVRSNQPPYRVPLLKMSEVGYAVGATEGHLFLLTSRRFVFFKDLVSGLLGGASLDKVIVGTVFVNASEMFLLGDRIALLVDGAAHILRIAGLACKDPTPSLHTRVDDKELPMDEATSAFEAASYPWEETTATLVTSEAAMT